RSRSAAFMSPQFQTLEQERETRLVSNYALAKENLSLRPRLEDGKAALAIKYQELREIREACWDKQQRLGTYAATRSPQGALGRLQAELEAAEAESEAQMERFLSQELPLDAFLESFRRSRAQSHLRRARVEKLQDLLRAERLRGAPGAPTPAPP
ncbi:VP37D protein, partial [Eudromia elegans]|nr:VP37D protein [Eudromia elegans]